MPICRCRGSHRAAPASRPRRACTGAARGRPGLGDVAGGGRPARSYAAAAGVVRRPWRRGFACRPGWRPADLGDTSFTGGHAPGIAWGVGVCGGSIWWTRRAHPSNGIPREVGLCARLERRNIGTRGRIEPRPRQRRWPMRISPTPNTAPAAGLCNQSSMIPASMTDRSPHRSQPSPSGGEQAREMRPTLRDTERRMPSLT